MSVGPTIRLDKWLWQARFCKSRSVAAQFVGAGSVRVNAVRVSKPSTSVRVGDGLSFAQGGRVRVIRIRALGERRGPASEAITLYDDLDPPKDAEGQPLALDPDPQPVK